MLRHWHLGLAEVLEATRDRLGLTLEWHVWLLVRYADQVVFVRVARCSLSRLHHLGPLAGLLLAENLLLVQVLDVVVVVPQGVQMWRLLPVQVLYRIRSLLRRGGLVVHGSPLTLHQVTGLGLRGIAVVEPS